jgi:hypothetical protein
MPIDSVQGHYTWRSAAVSASLLLIVLGALLGWPILPEAGRWSVREYVPALIGITASIAFSLESLRSAYDGDFRFGAFGLVSGGFLFVAFVYLSLRILLVSGG